MQDIFKVLFVAVAFFASFILGMVFIVNSQVRIDEVYRHSNWAVKVCTDHKGAKLLTLYNYKVVCNDGTEITAQSSKED